MIKNFFLTVLMGKENGIVVLLMLIGNFVDLLWTIEIGIVFFNNIIIMKTTITLFSIFDLNLHKVHNL